MKKALVVFSIVLILSTCHLLDASSLDLEKDKKSGDAYNQALSIHSEDRAKLQVKTDKAVDALIKTTVGELKARGYHTLAGVIEMEYLQRYKGFVLTFKPGRDVGDHEAIKWLLKIHDDIEFVVGPTICKALRLHDLWWFAYTIPVVFSCLDNVDKGEYGKHYVPLCGLVSFWLSYATCSVVSFSSGVIFLCNIIGMGVEELTVRFVAPLTINPAYKAACQ